MVKETYRRVSPRILAKTSFSQPLNIISVVKYVARRNSKGVLVWKAVGVAVENIDTPMSKEDMRKYSDAWENPVGGLHNKPVEK